jgi:hypothetical protein
MDAAKTLTLTGSAASPSEGVSETRHAALQHMAKPKGFIDIQELREKQSAHPTAKPGAATLTLSAKNRGPFHTCHRGNGALFARRPFSSQVDRAVQCCMEMTQSGLSS